MCTSGLKAGPKLYTSGTEEDKIFFVIFLINYHHNILLDFDNDSEYTVFVKNIDVHLEKSQAKVGLMHLEFRIFC